MPVNGELINKQEEGEIKEIELVGGKEDAVMTQVEGKGENESMDSDSNNHDD